LLLASGLLAGCNDSSSSSASSDVVQDSMPAGRISRPASPTPASNGSNPVVASDKDVDVTWSAPTANTNGSALTNLAGYTIYYGTNPTSLEQSISIPNASATDYVMQGLPGGTWYFAVKAYTSAGLESSYSSVVSRTIT
jgi:hypothetical protein